MTKPDLDELERLARAVLDKAAADALYLQRVELDLVHPKAVLWMIERVRELESAYDAARCAADDLMAACNRDTELNLRYRTERDRYRQALEALAKHCDCWWSSGPEECSGACSGGIARRALTEEE